MKFVIAVGVLSLLVKIDLWLRIPLDLKFQFLEWNISLNICLVLDDKFPFSSLAFPLYASGRTKPGLVGWK